MPSDILDLAAQRQSRGEPFALATVVRTLDVTAAKAGAKALIGQDGSISEGWIGGGCARAAVLKAARQARETSSHMSRLNALRRSGRFSVIVATWDSRSTS